MEECSKVDMLGNAAISLVLGHPVDINKLAARLDGKSGPLADAVTTLRATASGLRESPGKEQALTVMEKAKTTLDAAVNALKSGPQVSQETADNLSAISGTLGHAIGAIQRKG